MQLTEKLKAIGADVKRIRQSMSIVDPRSAGFSNTHEGLNRSDRLVAPSGAAWQRRVAEAASLIADVYQGRRPSYHLREAMTTSDFPNLFGDLLYRQLLGNYTPYPVTYPNWCRIVEVQDFRSLHLYAIDGGQGLLGPSGSSLTAIKEREPYPEVVFKETPYSVKVLKYGRRYGITFEMVINDDLNAFQQRPMMMAVGARRSEEYLATTMIADINGPHASFFTAGNKNIVTGNPQLSIAGLQTAYAVLAAQKDADGQPIVIEGVQLVVPPALEISAQNILNASQIRVNANTNVPPGGATLDQFIYTANWMSKRVQLSVNPYLPFISSTANGDSSWYLIANPNDLGTRPAVVFAFMRGRRQPQLFMKDPDQRALGGGESDPMEGNFDTDSIDYKLRHIFGATQVDPKLGVASNGSGS